MLATLYNAKVESSTSIVGLADIAQIQMTEVEIEANIVLKKKSPLLDIDENIRAYLYLTDSFKEYKKHNVLLANILLEKLRNNNTFSGDDLYLIKKSFDLFYKLNTKMNEFGSLYSFKASTMASTFQMPEVKVPMVKAHLIWLSSNLMIMQQLLEIHEIVYATDGAFRRIFKGTITNSRLTKQDLKSLKDLINQAEKIQELVESKKFLQQIVLVRSIEKDIRLILNEDANSLKILDEVMNNSLSNEIAQGKTVFKLSGYFIDDAVIGLFNKITNFLSGFFGNVAGNIKFRTGYLSNNAEALEIAQKGLRPMDIILEKSPFVLTDKFIPGHFGHAAIYLGTKEQLEEIGMWNHPDIIPYQLEIEAGRTILEAVRSGVRLNSLEDFLNIDEMTIVRKSDALNSKDQVAEQIRRGIDQLGKAYDFNFDISTFDKIVCSELIYIVFGHVKWPTRYRVGRPTITPDDIAETLFYKNSKFDVSDYMLSTERHRIEMSTKKNLADIFEFELRAENGEEVKDPQDPTNGFWKKHTKCYKLAYEDDGQGLTRSCKTTYKEFYYEESGS
jgi:hypothetical protein